RRSCPAPEALEGRLVLSGGQGSTFAIMPGTVSSVGQISSVPIKIDPSLLTAPKSGRILLGIDIAPVTPASASTSNVPVTLLKPEIVAVADASGHLVPVQHFPYNRPIARANHLGNAKTSAVLVSLKVPAHGEPAAEYT